MEQYVATVGEILTNQKTGERFARAYSFSSGSITFTLTPEIWKGAEDPIRGSLVVLSEIKVLASGNRAMKARQYDFEEDEQNPELQAQRELLQSQYRRHKSAS